MRGNNSSPTLLDHLLRAAWVIGYAALIAVFQILKRAERRHTTS